MMPVGEEFETTQPEVVIQRQPGSDQPPVLNVRVKQDPPLNAEMIARIEALIAKKLLADAQRRALVEDKQAESIERGFRWSRQAFGAGVGVGFLILIAIETALLQLTRY
jgi:hypothetical protein